MIRFLRTFRQRLLAENRGSKYLLYAIGEILLVVIGILIALQINTWEDNRKNASLRQEYLQSLRTELQTDFEYWTLVKKENDTVIRITKNLIRDIQDGAGAETSLNLLRIMQTRPIYSQNSTYTDLVSSGNMALITPFDLRQKLITHYKFIEMFLVHSQREYDYVWNESHPFFNNQGYYDWQAGLVQNNVDPSNPSPSVLKHSTGSSNYKALENNINFRRVILNSQNGLLNQVLISTQQMVQEIEKQLTLE